MNLAFREGRDNFVSLKEICQIKVLSDILWCDNKIPPQ